jgi:hypothetical protein
MDICHLKEKVRTIGEYVLFVMMVRILPLALANKNNSSIVLSAEQQEM